MAYKKEFHCFVISEYEEEEQYLRDMAKKGYLFEKVTLPGIFHFRKSEPMDMVYHIDFNPQKKENRASYLQMYKDYGWEYIQDKNEFSYFCKPEDGSDDEIFSDNPSRIEMMERIQKRKMLPILTLLLCWMALIVLMLVDGEYKPSIVICILWTIPLLEYAYLIARCKAGFEKLKKKYDV